MPHAVHIKIHKFIIKNGLVSLFRLSVYAEASAPGVDADVLFKFAMNIQKVLCRLSEGSAPSHSTQVNVGRDCAGDREVPSGEKLLLSDVKQLTG